MTEFRMLGNFSVHDHYFHVAIDLRHLPLHRLI